MKFPFLFRIEKFGLLVSSFFFDSSFLTSKTDMLINTKKSNERSGYTKLWSIMKRKSVS